MTRIASIRTAQSKTVHAKAMLRWSMQRRFLTNSPAVTSAVSMNGQETEHAPTRAANSGSPEAQNAIAEIGACIQEHGCEEAACIDRHVRR